MHKRVVARKAEAARKLKEKKRLAALKKKKKKRGFGGGSSFSSTSASTTSAMTSTIQKKPSTTQAPLDPKSRTSSTKIVAGEGSNVSTPPNNDAIVNIDIKPSAE